MTKRRGGKATKSEEKSVGESRPGRGEGIKKIAYLDDELGMRTKKKRRRKEGKELKGGMGPAKK